MPYELDLSLDNADWHPLLQPTADHLHIAADPPVQYESWGLAQKAAALVLLQLGTVQPVSAAVRIREVGSSVEQPARETLVKSGLG